MEAPDQPSGVRSALSETRPLDVLVVLGVLATTSLMILSKTMSVYVAAALLVVLVAQLYGMVLESRYDGPGALTLLGFAVVLVALVVS